MCYYITATLPKGTKIDTLVPIFDNYEMTLSPVNNENVKSQLPFGELYFRPTQGYCDCDTVLGSLDISQKHEALVDSKKVKKLRKKGWSKEKINNWITEKMLKERAKKQKKDKYWPDFRNQQATRWINFLRELLDTGLTFRVGILIHWYNGGLDSEEIEIKKTQRVNVESINAEVLMNLKEDVLYEFF
ncbi:hypothetical protein [Candidatus Borrarchaeum sp.]|uniref:hypothetical protein n=1 Tax=Candidatus Borrarchaeum sp. TaxID=2846742 RepID=UPI0025796835|nr:hypothetical protein [Candidatus Borrarchaeum sp.]